MQLRMSIKMSFLVMVLLSSNINPMRHVHTRLPVYRYNSQAEDLGKAVVAVGCIAAIGYGFYKLCDWLFSKTDVQVLQEAQNVHNNAERATNVYVEFFERKWGGLSSLSSTQKREIMHALDEGLLYQFALAHAFRTSLEYTILSDLHYSLTSARSAHSMVVERVHKLRKKKDITGMVSQLEVVQFALQDTIARIEFVYEYLHQHRSYYALLNKEYQVMKIYENDLYSLKQYEANPGALREALRIAVMRQATSKMTYPYMNYIQKISHEFSDLDQHINALSCHYPERMAAARQLSARLQTIYNMLIIEDAYRQELRDYERAQLEKQRIEAEQAKAAAAQAAAHAAQVQAAAMQQQVWELQKQNQLHAQQNRIEQDRNVILTAATIVDAINPRPVQEVHVYN